MTTLKPVSRARQWVLSALPLVSALLVLWAWRLPAGEGSDYLSLIGTWRGAPTPLGTDVVGPRYDDSGWAALTLPGVFDEAGLSGKEVTLRRTVTLPGNMRGTDLRFVLGYVRDAVVRVYVNGHLVGARGVYETGFMGSDSEVTSVLVPRDDVGDGAQATVVLQLKPNPAEQTGVADGRLLFGRNDLLLPWAFHQASVRSALELGALASIGFMMFLVAVLWRLQRGRVDVDLFRGTMVLNSATLFYLVSTTGFLISAALSPTAGVKSMDVSVQVLGLVIPEFVEAYFLGRVTWFRKLNRLVSGLGVVVSLGLAFVSDAGPERLYEYYAWWLFVLVAYALFVAVRNVAQGGPGARPYGPLVLTAISFAVFSGVNDLLGDMNVLFTPRLFTLGITNLSICSAIVLIGEFLQMADENRQLSQELGDKNQQLVIALKQAEDSGRARSAFLANTSHELRTPLNSIINIPLGLLERVVEDASVTCTSCGHAFTLDEGTTWSADVRCPRCHGATKAVAATRRLDLDTERLERLLHSVANSGQHLLAVVNDVLDYSKLDAGRMTLRLEQVTLADLLGQLQLTMEPQANKAGVQLVLDPAPPLTLNVDRVKLSQVLMNLVVNAIKFSDGQGTVTVTAVQHGATLQLRVRDHGIGIAPEHQAFIFDGFRQVEDGSTRRFGGTGLGLAISRQLMELHGGTLRVESALGAGSTFIASLSLPAGQLPE
jgi:signal transduction histidine kinase